MSLGLSHQIRKLQTFLIPFPSCFESFQSLFVCFPVAIYHPVPNLEVALWSDSICIQQLAGTVAFLVVCTRFKDLVNASCKSLQAMNLVKPTVKYLLRIFFHCSFELERLKFQLLCSQSFICCNQNIPFLIIAFLRQFINLRCSPGIRSFILLHFLNRL